MKKDKLLELSTVDMITIKGALAAQCSDLDRKLANTNDKQLGYVYKRQLAYSLELLEKFNAADGKKLM